jgi:hypothetical protein
MAWRGITSWAALSGSNAIAIAVAVEQGVAWGLVKSKLTGWRVQGCDARVFV